MVITPVSSHNLYPPDLPGKYKRGYEDFQRLARALNSGDLAGAQKAFAAFKLEIQNLQQSQKAQHASKPRCTSEQLDGTQTTTGNGTYIDVMA